MSKNEELTLELLNVVNAKSALVERSAAVSADFRHESNALIKEQQRIRTLLDRLSNPNSAVAEARTKDVQNISAVYNKQVRTYLYGSVIY